MGKTVMVLVLPEPKIRKATARAERPHRDKTRYTRKVKHKAPDWGLFINVTYWKIFFLPQQNVSECGENRPEYVSEYVPQTPPSGSRREGEFFVTLSVFPATDTRLIPKENPATATDRIDAVKTGDALVPPYMRFCSVLSDARATQSLHYAAMRRFLTERPSPDAAGHSLPRLEVKVGNSDP